MDCAVDLAVLGAFAADVDDPATVAAVVDAYLDQLPLRRAAVVEASARGDLAALADLGHTLRASSAMLGALRLAELAEDLERAARTGRVDDAQGGVALLVGECAAVDVGAAGLAPALSRSRPERSRSGQDRPDLGNVGRRPSLGETYLG